MKSSPLNYVDPSGHFVTKSKTGYDNRLAINASNAIQPEGVSIESNTNPYLHLYNKATSKIAELMEMAENSSMVLTCGDFQYGFELGQERIYTKIKQSMLYMVYGNRITFLKGYLNNWELDELYLEAADQAENEDAFYFGYGLGVSAGLAEIALMLYGGAVATGNALSAGAASISGGTMAMQTTAGTVVVAGGGTAVVEGAIGLYPTILGMLSASSESNTADKDDYKAPDGGGGITDKINVGNKEVEFGHGGRHLQGNELSINEVNQAIAKDVVSKHPGTGLFYKGRVTVNGTIIEYTSFGLTEGRINVGTYYPLKEEGQCR